MRARTKSLLLRLRRVHNSILCKRIILLARRTHNSNMFTDGCFRTGRNFVACLLRRKSPYILLLLSWSWARFLFAKSTVIVVVGEARGNDDEEIARENGKSSWMARGGKNVRPVRAIGTRADTVFLFGAPEESSSNRRRRYRVRGRMHRRRHVHFGRIRSPYTFLVLIHSPLPQLRLNDRSENPARIFRGRHLKKRPHPSISNYVSDGGDCRANLFPRRWRRCDRNRKKLLVLYLRARCVPMRRRLCGRCVIITKSNTHTLVLINTNCCQQPEPDR